MASGNKQTWQVRHTSSDDTSAIAGLVNSHWQALCGEKRIGEDEARSWFERPGVPQDDTQGWWARDGVLRAYAQVYKSDFPNHWDGYYDITVDPERRGDRALWDEVFRWCDAQT